MLHAEGGQAGHSVYRNWHIGSPLEKRWALFSCLAVRSPRDATQALLRRHVALFIHPLVHRRELMCVLGAAQSWMAQLSFNGAVKFSCECYDELAMATLLVLSMESNVHRPVSPRSSMTDATPLRGGAVLVHPDLAQSL